jgi:glutamine amidotransferase
MEIAVIDYGSGNLRSVARALAKASEGKARVTIASEPGALERASHIVLPGVGAFADCMNGLRAIPGMLAALERSVLREGTPFLGICVGMQMLFERGEEHGVYAGLGWLSGSIVKIEAQGLKIPHMGWNELHLTQQATHPLTLGITQGEHVYFVHSYRADCAPDIVLATTDYGAPLPATVAKGQIMGTQFHPEKSQEAGIRLLRNFVRLTKASFS